MQDEVLQQVDRDRIVELACNLANIVSITGEEEDVAKYLGYSSMSTPFTCSIKI